MTRRLIELGRDNSAAVAPTVALSLFALIAVGGIAFDYARLATMDTELQNAADQAALAAASQLDKKAGACERAIAAAMTLAANQTRFANDGNASGVAVTITQPNICDDGVPEPGEEEEDPGGINFDPNASIRFYQDKARTPADNDSNARFVEITVNSRQARYALTPIAAAFSSGAIAATAFAGLGSAICKVPPLMMCNPDPTTPFVPEDWRGRGIRVFEAGNGWAPGAFGYLDVGATNNGTPDQRIALAMNNPNTNCVADEAVNVDTGVSASVLDAYNVRFDIFAQGWAQNTCYGHAGCSPAWNSTKDLVRDSPPAGADDCAIQNNKWHLPSDADQYIPSNAAGDDSQIVHMGYPMDVCHYPTAGKSCGGSNERFGDGFWRRDLYFKTNHNVLTGGGTNWQSTTGLPANASRYDVYRWEQNVAGVGNDDGSLPEKTAGGSTQYGRAICKPPGLAPSSSTPDRRVMVVAVADNCGSLGGANRAVDVGAWAEVFLVQPAAARGNGPNQRTAANDIYIEIIGRANPTNSGATAQVVHRDVPYLIE